VKPRPLGLFRRAISKRRFGPKRWFVSHATPESADARRQLSTILPGDELEFFYQHDPPVDAPRGR
jgi:hypothetical protein